METQYITRLRTWLNENGAFVHPDVRFEAALSGSSVLAQNCVSADTPVVAIPFSLAITPDVSRNALEKLLKPASKASAGWTERQLECTYLCMHWIVPSNARSDDDVLRHGPYIDTLPSSDKLRTPLHFSAAEIASFQGSNLYGATVDRRRKWEAEWQQCRSVLAATDPRWGERLTWERYVTASTYISSRAFPSTILTETPSLVTTPTSHPVLLPGIDSLNHARGHPVSWVVSSTPAATPSSASSEPCISLVIHTATPAGSELLNNYGPKPNSELILGYGFSLPNNPDDTIVLKIGGPSAVAPAASVSSSSGSSAGGWEVGRNARGAEPVWDAVLAAVRAQDADSDEEESEQAEGPSIEDELCAADMLADMAQSLHDRLPPFPPADAAEMREEVLQMLEHYLEGQRAILQSVVAFAREKEERAVQRAREEGLDIVDEEEEEGEEERNEA